MTRRLCVLDVDSTILTTGVIDLLTERAGRRDQAEATTEEVAHGAIAPDEALSRKVAALEGVPASIVDDVLATMRMTPGAENLVETLHTHGWVVGLVSNGFTEVVGPLAARLGITRYCANGLEVAGGFLTGRMRGPIVDGRAKEVALLEYAEAEGISMVDTVAIGGGADDLGMMRAAGRGIAFNSRSTSIDGVGIAVTSSRLDAVLEYIEL
jgi:phosphoserine phosphatase